MEWVLVGAGVLSVVLWRVARRGDVSAGRSGDGTVVRKAPVVSRTAIQAGATAVAPLAWSGSRGVLHPDNPDGAFMDGYVAGRYTERAEHRSAAVDGATAGPSGATSSRLGDDDDTADEAVDDAWGGSWSGGSDGSLHHSHQVWSDPDDAFDDDSSDDW